MENFTHTKKMLGVSAVIVVVLLVGYGYIVREIFNINKSAGELEAGVQIEILQEGIERSTKNLVFETQEDRKKLDSLFLDESEIVPFIEHIESLGGVSGVTLDILTVNVVSPDIDQDIYEWLKISIGADGSWEGVYHLLSLLDRIPRALLLENVEMGVKGVGVNQKQSDMWSTKVDLLFAKRKQNK